MVDVNHSNLNTELKIEIDNEIKNSKIIEKPFFDPKKQITKS